MKRDLIIKIISAIIVSTTLCTLNPVAISAEWAKDYQGNWYYLQNNERITGWKKINGQVYYFDDNGQMKTGWIKAEDTWYFLDNSGALRTGWINYNKNSYYTDSTGAMQTGIINIDGRIYILNDNGTLKTSNTVINGQFYTIGSDGAVVGNRTPTPSKEFDAYGNCITVLKDQDGDSVSPVHSEFDDVIKDQSNDDAAKDEYYGVEYTLKYKDSDGKELKSKTVSKGKSINLYKPSKDGYNFKEWNTKSDGSGKSYDDDEDVKINKNLVLYARWDKDTTVYVQSITISGSSNVVINKTIQMTASVLPSNAANKKVTWSVVSGTGKATIDSNGVLTGTANGTVTVKATSADGSKIVGTKEVTVGETEVTVPVTSIAVNSSTGSSKITTSGGTLQMTATVSPTNATKQDITWSVENRTGSATISSTGLLTAVSNGVVTVKATAADGSSVVGSKTITLSGQATTIPVESITVAGKNNATTITTDGGTLQMIATVLPSSATNNGISWTVENGTGSATISSTGLLKAGANGTVTVKATSKANNQIVGTKEITISGQTIKVQKITVNGDNITTDGGTTQMSAVIEPSSATNTGVVWTVENGTGSATINSANGVLTAKSNGTVTVKATAKDSSGIVGTKEITISGQSSTVAVSTVTVSGKDGATSITTDDGTLQMSASLSPSYATTPSSIVWSVVSGTGSASIDSNGLLKAGSNGTVTVKATVTNTDGTKVYGTKIINLSGQYVQVDSIDVSSTSDTMPVDGTLQMSATVSPSNATYQNVDWSVESETGRATITSAGVLTGMEAGTVNVIATAKDSKKAVGSKTITIIPKVKVTGITVDGEGSASTITTDKGTLKMTASISPTDATNKEVTWSVEKAGDAGTTMTGTASITSDGVLTAATDGTVTVKATAADGSGIVGTKVITISNQVIKVTGITVTGAGNATTISIIGGTLQMSAAVSPTNAASSAVTWSVENGTGTATIDATGLLTGTANGTVTVKATAADGSGIVGTKVITINAITSIAITGSDTVASGKTLQLAATILPTTITNKTVTWTVANFISSETAHAAIDTSGKLTAVSAGVVVVTATATDGSGKVATKNITIT